MTRGRALAALAATAAALGGCGSTPLSLKDLRQDATTICQTAARQTGRIAAPASPAQAVGFLTAGIAPLTRELRDLRGLNPPSAQAGQFRTATGALAESIDLLRRARAAIRQGTDPATAVRGLQSSLAPVQDRGNSAWTGLGIPACVGR